MPTLPITPDSIVHRNVCSLSKVCRVLASELQTVHGSVISGPLDSHDSYIVITCIPSSWAHHHSFPVSPFSLKLPLLLIIPIIVLTEFESQSICSSIILFVSLRILKLHLTPTNVIIRNVKRLLPPPPNSPFYK